MLRPATITAAAVLLIVVGVQHAMAVLVVIVVFCGAMLVKFESSAVLGGFVCIGICLTFGAYFRFLWTGVSLLKGTLIDLEPASRRYIWTGTILIGCLIVFTGLVIHDSLHRPALTASLVYLLAVGSSAWLNAVSVFLAGWFLKRHAQKYFIWRDSLAQVNSRVDEGQYDQGDL